MKRVICRQVNLMWGKTMVTFHSFSSSFKRFGLLFILLLMNVSLKFWFPACLYLQRHNRGSESRI